MIIQPFRVRSKNIWYDFVDRDALDSQADKDEVNKRHGAALNFVQTNALCNNRGLADRGEIDNRVLAVFDPDGVLIGIWMLGCITYVSGPWADLQAWEVTDPGADVILEAVPMSGLIGIDDQGLPFPTMAEDDEADLAAETADILVSKPNLALLSGQGLAVGLDRLHYGLFQLHDDPISKRAQSHHAKVKAHPRLDVTETPHPTILNLTLVEIRAA